MVVKGTDEMLSRQHGTRQKARRCESTRDVTTDDDEGTRQNPHTIPIISTTYDCKLSHDCPAKLNYPAIIYFPSFHAT